MCLRANPAAQHAACSVRSATQSRRSVCGPKIRRKRFTRFMLYRVSVAMLGCSSPVAVSSVGSRCRGQCTNLKSCGDEYRKFAICGRKNITSVSLKWPRIPATPRVIPAKYVNVSPTNTLDGYQLCAIRPSVHARNGAARHKLKRCASCIVPPASSCAAITSTCRVSRAAITSTSRNAACTIDDPPPRTLRSASARVTSSSLDMASLPGPTPVSLPPDPTSTPVSVPVLARVLTLSSTTAAAMTALCPASNPLIPAWMLMLLAQKMTRRNMYA
mmetsp:Transcript_38107/g.94704  ORF Transcript_38107/g.94704 Transcript_38107/m.94704 type:complete len:273 (-) Transcript_38107:883-1701(-)